MHCKVWYVLKIDNPTKTFEKYYDYGNRFYVRNNSSFLNSWKKNKQAHYSIKIMYFQYFIKNKIFVAFNFIPRSKELYSGHISNDRRHLFYCIYFSMAFIDFVSTRHLWVAPWSTWSQVCVCRRAPSFRPKFFIQSY